MKETRQQPAFRIVNPARALVAFFFVGVGLSFSLAMLSVAIGSFRHEASAALTDEGLNSKTVETAMSIPLSSSSMAAEPVVASRQSELVHPKAESSDIETRAAPIPREKVVAFIASVVSSTRYQAEGKRTAETAPVIATHARSACEEAFGDCVDLCSNGSVFADATDVGFDDEVEVCEAACADGKTRCATESEAKQCSAFIGACRFRCHRDSNSDGCEDSCELGQEACIVHSETVRD